jgi:hypothetical protein
LVASNTRLVFAVDTFINSAGEVIEAPIILSNRALRIANLLVIIVLSFGLEKKLTLQR